MELSDLYSQKILDLAGNATQPGRLADADASARKVSRVCGSVIEVDIKVRNGVTGTRFRPVHWGRRRPRWWRGRS